MIAPAELKRLAKKNADALGDCSIFLLLFNPAMIEETIPLLQMGLAVYMDKPIGIICSDEYAKKLPENVRRLARALETFDDTLPQGLRESAYEAAVNRLLAVMKEFP